MVHQKSVVNTVRASFLSDELKWNTGGYTSTHPEHNLHTCMGVCMKYVLTGIVLLGKVLYCNFNHDVVGRMIHEGIGSSVISLKSKFPLVVNK